MELSVEYRHDYNSMLRFVTLHRKVRQKGLRVLNTVLMVCLSLSAVGLTVVNVLFDSWDFKSIFLLILEGIVMLGFVFRNHINAFVSSKRILKKAGVLNMVFSKDAVKVTTGVGREEYLYTAFCDLFFMENTLYAYLDKNHALIFPGEAVKNGNIRELCAFLSEKTGLKIKTVK